MTGTQVGPEALAAGKAFVDLSSWRTIAVSGTEAFTWLNDIVSADIDGLAQCEARRSLFLAPTGGVRASFTVAMPFDTLLLIQDPSEPRPIDGLLSTYVLSSDVQIEDRSGDFAIFAFPGTSDVPAPSGTAASISSALGAGADVMAPARDHDRLAASFAESFAQATGEAVEAWRVAMAIPRVGLDTADGDLPQEGGLQHAVAFDKGCFLGQEAVAKVRNLGHPRRLLLPLEGDGPLAAGDEVMSDDERAGVITSAARFDGRIVALARIRWEHRDGALRTSDGVGLRTRPVRSPDVPGPSDRAATPSRP
jgi:folate-binding protein YgfZ